jgi:CheY-like chemotaxis protein
MKRHVHQPFSLLIIEDSDEDFEALKRIINQVSAFPLSIDRCIDGDDALDFLNREGIYSHVKNRPSPELIILDLNLPGTDGREVLVTIKQSKHLKTIPVVVLSTSANPKDIEDCYQYGVNSYMLKPMNIGDLTSSIQTLLDYWLKAMILPNSINF